MSNEMKQITSMGERVTLFRKQKNLSQQELADIIGVSRGYIGDIERGRSDPSTSFLTLLTSKFNVSSDWVLTGEGTMLKGGGASNDELSERNRWLISMFNKLEPDDQDDAIKEIKKIAENREIRRELMQVRQEVRQLARSAA